MFMLKSVTPLDLSVSISRTPSSLFSWKHRFSTYGYLFVAFSPYLAHHLKIHLTWVLTRSVSLSLIYMARSKLHFSGCPFSFFFNCCFKKGFICGKRYKVENLPLSLLLSVQFSNANCIYIVQRPEHFCLVNNPYWKHVQPHSACMLPPRLFSRFIYCF